MQTHLDPFDPNTLYADLREGETLTDALRARALERAHERGARFVEFWTAPYGEEPHDRMAGFVATATVQVCPPVLDHPAFEATAVAP